MPKATDEDIARVRAANPGVDIDVVTHPTIPHDFIVRSPGRAVWNIYRQKAGNDAERVQADDVLFDSCVLWPDKADREQLAERYPALVNVVAAEVAEIAGATRSATHRKL